MKIIQPSFEITNISHSEPLKFIEKIGRTCYKSEDNITETSAEKFVKNIIKNGHEAVIEHVSITVKIICDRGISHEWVRHRVASYAQESTRYCSYNKDKFNKEITYIDIIPVIENRLNPLTIGDWDALARIEDIIKDTYQFIENKYMELINLGVTAQEARCILPNGLKTELVCTMNLREWRHFLKLRTSKAAHPQIREITIPLLKALQREVPIIFDDIIIVEENND